jgi:TRAP-type C4-dicarboxylate transport system substrate-binding protein
MRKPISVFLFAVFGASFLLCGPGAVPAKAQDLTLRFAWYMPPDTATANQGNAIAKEIESLSKGTIHVQTYPSGSLLKESNISEGVANNTANMGIFAMHWWSKQEPSLEWDTIPFLIDDAGALLKALHGKLGDDVNKILNKHGIQIVGWGFYGYAKCYINTKHPIKVPGDLKGLHMRSEGKLSALFLKSQGATPVAVDSSEVYTAMQRGVLDGGVSGLSSIVSRKWFEVGKYVTAIHYVPLVYPVQANVQWWKSLTRGQRDIISRAIAKTEGSAVANIENEFTKDIKIAEKNGDQVYRPTPAELRKWKATAGAMGRKHYLAETGEPGKQFIADVKMALGHGRM